MKWTKHEDAELFSLAGTMTIAQAASRLGRSHRSVAHRIAQLRLSWRQGCYGLRDVARAAGCGVTAARRCVEILFWDAPRPRIGTGAGLRYTLDCAQLDRAARLLRRTQTPEVQRVHKAAAGRAGRGKPKRRKTG